MNRPARYALALFSYLLSFAVSYSVIYLGFAVLYPIVFENAISYKKLSDSDGYSYRIPSSIGPFLGQVARDSEPDTLTHFYGYGGATDEEVEIWLEDRYADGTLDKVHANINALDSRVSFQVRLRGTDGRVSSVGWKLYDGADRWKQYGDGNVDGRWDTRSSSEWGDRVEIPLGDEWVSGINDAGPNGVLVDGKRLFLRDGVWTEDR